jgi:Tfp pilus assembly protein PilO
MDTTFLGRSASKYSVIAIILLILALAGLIFYVKPSWDEVDSLAKGRDEKSAQKSQLQTQLTELQKIQEQLNMTSEVNRQTSLAAIPEKLEEDKLILDLTDIASKNNIVMNSVSFGIPTAASGGEIAKATVNANLVGTESDLIKYLKGVESNARKILVKNITVQLASQEAEIKLANFNVSMETYFQGAI